MTPALINMCSDESRFNNYFINCEGQSHKAVSTDTTFEAKGEADSKRRPSAYPPNALPLGQTGLLC